MVDMYENTSPANIDGKLYLHASQLRQSKDIEWIVGLLRNQTFATAGDLCCGCGALIAAFLQNKLVHHRIVGIDKSKSMIETAQGLIPQDGRVEVKLYQANLLEEPEIHETFDLVTMLSALHWLYPQEQKVFQWIKKRLSPGGCFCLTIYQPLDCEHGYGGTDHLILAAMQKLGLPQRFPTHFLSIGTRTRKKEDVVGLLQPYFVIETTVTRVAEMKVRDEQEYISYHLATFGDYYLHVVPKELRDVFLRTLGTVACERMEHLGYVTKMNVSALLCRLPDKLHNEVR